MVRTEADGRLRRYVHVGTGNYNPKTARVYEDLGLLTADPDVGADVADLFNHLSGYTRHRDYETLLVAPDTLRPGLLDADRRARRGAPRRASRPASRMKVNSLVDEDVVDALYDASRAGVPVDLLVRGMCASGQECRGCPSTIRVRSLLGRFLEHSRIYRFDNAGNPRDCGSAAPTSWTATSTAGSRRWSRSPTPAAGRELDRRARSRLVAATSTTGRSRRTARGPAPRAGPA